MINVQHSTVNEEHFPYRTLSSQGLEAYASIRYSTLSIDRADFSSLLADFFSKTMKSHQLYFAYLEPGPQQKHRMRSHKKMFYSALQAGQLSKAEVWEEELEVSTNCSLLGAVIRGTEDNIGYVMEQQLHTNFRFGFILPKNECFDPSELLHQITSYLRPASKLTRVDFPKLLQRFSVNQAHVFYMPFDANGKLQLSLFAHRKDTTFLEMLSAIDQEYALPQGN
jgi:ribosomal protein S6E (S10)